jgi:sugar lactone lactonase YvrE
MSEFTTLVGGLSFTECPRWRDGRLYVSDFYMHRVLALAMEGTAKRFGPDPAVFRVGISDQEVEKVASLNDFRRVITPWRTWIGVTPDGALLLMRDTGTQEVYAFDLEAPQPRSAFVKSYWATARPSACAPVPHLPYRKLSTI